MLRHMIIPLLVLTGIAVQARTPNLSLIRQEGVMQWVNTVFLLWDTYRAVHPFYTLLRPECAPDMVNTMFDIYAQQGIQDCSGILSRRTLKIYQPK